MAITERSPHLLDRQLRAEVGRALAVDPDVQRPNIGVAVTNHVVGLSGTVRSEADRAVVVATARGVGGVLTIIDDIVLMSPTKSDRVEHAIALAVEHELARVAFELPTLQATVRGNVVTLTGIVDERRQKHTVVFAIREIEHVTWVEDRIIVREHTLHTRIRSAVGRRDELDADAIHVRVCGSEVWISGASSSMARDHAARVLLAAPGVDVVHDEVTITEPVGPMALSAQDGGAHDCR